MDLEKKEKIISCYGNMKNKSVAKIFNVSTNYISAVWSKSGCLDDEDEYEEWIKTQKCI